MLEGCQRGDRGCVVSCVAPCPLLPVAVPWPKGDKCDADDDDDDDDDDDADEADDEAAWVTTSPCPSPCCRAARSNKHVSTACTASVLRKGKGKQTSTKD